MKIIRPLEDVRNKTNSDAPMDAVETWEPEGRDLLEYLDSPVFDAVGDTMIAVSSKGGDVYKQSLATGETSKIGFSVLESNRSVLNVKISPDESMVYILSLYFRLEAAFVDISTGVRKFRKNEDKPAYGVFYSSGANDCTDGILWDADSKGATFICASSVSYVDAVTWVSSEIYDTATDYVKPWFPQPGLDVVGGTLQSILRVGSDLYVTGVQAAEDQSTLPPYSVRFDTFVLKISSTGQVVAHSHRAGAFGGWAWLRYNGGRGQILYFSDLGAKIMDPDLSLQNWPSAPQSMLLTKPAAIYITDTHLITRSLSTTPYWNYRLLTDYSLAKSLPALPAPGEGIAVATDYTVVQQPQGIALLNNVDDSIIQQQNPNVVKGDLYIYQDHVYEALLNNNSRPDQGLVAVPPATTPDWLDLGFINPLRMFDGKLDSLTQSDTSLTVTITPNQLVSGIALFNVSATTVQISMTDPTDGLVFDSGPIEMLDNSAITNWFDFFFAPYLQKSDYATLDLPPYPQAVVTVTLDNQGGATSIGELVIGRVQRLGEAQYNTSVGILDFSRKEQDQFGNFNIVPRRFSKRAEFDVKVMTGSVSGVQRILAELRASPVVWVGDDQREETIVYGYYRSFDIVLSNPSLSDTTITVEGL